MKYTITMTKTEIKSLCNSFTALSKTVLNNVIRDIDESYAEILKSGLTFGDYVDKLTTSGGASNKDFAMEYIVSKDTVTVNAEMSIKLIQKVLSFYNKYIADFLPYIVAFAKKHEDELQDLTEFLNYRAERMNEALIEMIEDFDMDALVDSAWGCFKEALNPMGINTDDTPSKDTSADDFEDICKTTDEMLDDVVSKVIEVIDAASDKEAEMHRFGNAVSSAFCDLDADDAVYLTKQIFGRIIDHYEEQEKLSKEEELERKYHGKNTEE